MVPWAEGPSLFLPVWGLGGLWPPAVGPGVCRGSRGVRGGRLVSSVGAAAPVLSLQTPPSTSPSLPWPFFLTDPHGGPWAGPQPRSTASPQVPIHALWNDGRENLLGALLMAGQYVIPEVPPSSAARWAGDQPCGSRAQRWVPVCARGPQVGHAGEEAGGALKIHPVK